MKSKRCIKGCRIPSVMYQAAQCDDCGCFILNPQKMADHKLKRGRLTMHGEWAAGLTKMWFGRA